MGPDGVVVDTLALDHDLRLFARVEDLTVEQLVAQLAIERFALAVLPWAARLDVERFGPQPREPAP
jgi:hypothetical protein